MSTVGWKDVQKAADSQRPSSILSAQAKFPLMLPKPEGGIDLLLLTTSTAFRNRTGPLDSTFHPMKSHAAFQTTSVYR